MLPVSLPELIAHWAVHDPHHVVFRDADGGQATNAELAAAADAWGSLLASLGVGRGEPVVTMLPNTALGHLGWLGASWIGAVEIPMNHAFPTTWIERLTREAGAGVAVVARQFAGQWRPLLNTGALNLLVVVDDLHEVEVWFAGGSSQPRTLVPTGIEPVIADRYDVSCVIFTSGTTGPSKGVVVPWGQWEARSDSDAIPQRFRGSDSVFYDPLPCCHTGGRIYFYDAVRHQSTVVAKERFSTTDWLDDIRRENCTGTVLIGATASFIHRSAPRPDDRDTGLRYVIMAPVPNWVDEFKERFGVEVVTSFSATEYAYPIISGEHFEVSAATSGSCGVADPAYDVRLVTDDGSDAAVDQPGELLVRGAPWTNCLGYWRRPAESVEAWRGGWFHTGDILRRDGEGRFYFVDRAKDMVRRRGENISSHEVESAALEHPEITAAAAYGVDSEHGEEDLMLSVELSAGSTLSQSDLHSFLVGRLPEFALPRFIDVHPQLPRTGTAKIIKRELREAGVTSSTWHSSHIAVRRPRKATAG